MKVPYTRYARETPPEPVIRTPGRFVDWDDDEDQRYTIEESDMFGAVRTQTIEITRDPYQDDYVAHVGGRRVRIPHKLIKTLSRDELVAFVFDELRLRDKLRGPPQPAKLEPDLYAEAIGPKPIWEEQPFCLWPRCERHNRDNPQPAARCRCAW